MEITMQSKNIVAVQRMLGRMIGSVDSVKQDFLHDLGEEWTDAVKNDIQNEQHVVTGELLATTGILQEESNAIVLGSTAPHAAIFEDGRGPVVPVHAKALHWKDKHTGEDVFSKYSGPVEGTGIFESNIIKIEKQFADLYAERQDAANNQIIHEESVED